jgi:cell division protein FtsZ
MIVATYIDAGRVKLWAMNDPCYRLSAVLNRRQLLGSGAKAFTLATGMSAGDATSGDFVHGARHRTGLCYTHKDCNRAFNARITVLGVGRWGAALLTCIAGASSWSPAVAVESGELATIAAAQDIVFVVARLDNELDMGASIAVARDCRATGAFTVGVGVLPEARAAWFRSARAMTASDAFEASVDSFVDVEDSQYLAVAHGWSRVTNDLLLDMGSALSGRATVNIDPEDLAAILSKPGRTVARMARGRGRESASIAAERAINHLVSTGADLAEARRVLVLVGGSRASLLLRELNQVFKTVRASAPDARIWYGTSLDERLGSDLRVTVLANSHEDAVGL